MKQTFGETSFMKGVPEGARNQVMHIQLPLTETVHLMGSDVVEGLTPPLQAGNNVHVSVVADDKAEADRVFQALSGDGGKVTMPIANAPWGPYFGMCIDRFGTQWMVSLTSPPERASHAASSPMPDRRAAADCDERAEIEAAARRALLLYPGPPDR